MTEVTCYRWRQEFGGLETAQVKRLEELAEIVPGLSRVGVVWQPASGSNHANLQELQAAAITLRLALDPFEVMQPEDFDAAFKATATRGVGFYSPHLAVRHTLANPRSPRCPSGALTSRLMRCYGCL